MARGTDRRSTIGSEAELFGDKDDSLSMTRPDSHLIGSLKERFQVYCSTIPAPKKEMWLTIVFNTLTGKSGYDGKVKAQTFLRELDACENDVAVCRLVTTIKWGSHSFEIAMRTIAEALGLNEALHTSASHVCLIERHELLQSILQTELKTYTDTMFTPEFITRLQSALAEAILIQQSLNCPRFDPAG